MNWSRGRIIGRGSSATVSIATDDQTGEVFAVKSTKVSNSELLKREQRILSTLMCPQIVACRGCDISYENGTLLYNIFLEHAPNGTLIDAIQRHGGNHGGGLDEVKIRSYTRAILQGLEYLHSNGIVHCDIKSRNVLITNGDGAKICDLGCARLVDEVSHADRSSSVPVRGTPIYMAPEVARGEQQNFPADVWALGCTVIEMATGCAPWVNLSDPVSVLYRIGFSSDVPEIPGFMSKQGKDFLDKCLKRDPLERWSASELLEHDFLKSQNSETPTSVLSQGLWASMEEGIEEATWNSTQKTTNTISPEERIRQLSQGRSENSDWNWDETWVTVRKNSGITEPEVATIASHHSEVPNEPTRIRMSEKITTCKSNCSKHEKGSQMACECEYDRIRRIQTLRKKILCLSIIHSLLNPP